MAGGMAGGIGLPHITRPKKRAPRSIPVIKHTTPDIQVSSNTTHQQCQLASFQKNYQKACLADKCIQTKAISNRIILDFRLNIHIMVYAKHNFHFLLRPFKLNQNLINFSNEKSQIEYYEYRIKTEKKEKTISRLSTKLCEFC